MEVRRDVFQALADPTRRSILHLLTQKPLNLNGIAEKFDASRPAISQHIKILAECGLVAIQQQGRERYCQLEVQKLNEVDQWLEPFRKLWTDRFDQLDTLLDHLKKDDNEQD